MLFPSSGVIALAFAASVQAAVYFTSPTSSIGLTGGDAASITWIDDGNSPSFSEFGSAKASIYTGNSAQQTSLQLISTSIDVSDPLYLNFTPDATIGPNGAYYFIRFESLALNDSTDASIPALAFSAVFTMSGMSGTFSDEIQSEIDGTSTAPIGGSTTSAAASSSTAAGTTTKTSSTASSKASSSSSQTSKAAAASGSSAAVPLIVASSSELWLGILIGVFGAVVGVAVLFASQSVA